MGRWKAVDGGLLAARAARARAELTPAPEQPPLSAATLAPFGTLSFQTRKEKFLWDQLYISLIKCSAEKLLSYRYVTFQIVKWL